MNDKNGKKVDAESFLRAKKRQLYGRLILSAGIIVTLVSLLGEGNDVHPFLFLWWPGVSLLIVGVIMTWFYTMQVYRHESYASLPDTNDAKTP